LIKKMKRKNKTSLLKKILKTLPVMLGVVFVFYAGLLIKNIEIPVVLPVNNVMVSGELNFLDEEEIKSTVKNNIYGGYFTVDLHRVREILLQEPWVKNVSLRRQWPASINVVIDEQVPVAYWNNDGYISERGDVFKPAFINKTLNLPALNGPEGQHNNVWKFMNTLYTKTALINYEVVRLDLDDRRAWQLEITNNLNTDNSVSENSVIEVKLGRFDTEKRMQRFVTILPALTVKNGLLENKIKVIDMRYPNGFAVQVAAAQMIEKNNSQTQNFPHNFVYAHQHATVQVSEA
jgi:cell division protein FtsQ